MLGGQHSKGLGCSRAGGSDQPSERAQKELQNKPQAMGSPGRRSRAHRPCTRCSCSASALTERMLLASASLVPAVTASSWVKSKERFLPAKTSQAGATAQAAPVFPKLFQRPVLPHPFSLYLRLPSNPSFSSQPAAFGGLKRCVHPQGWVPLPPRPSLPGMDLETGGSPDLISKTNIL